MTATVFNFLEERKQLWLKEKIKKAEDDIEIAELEQQAQEKYALENWTLDAVNRVSQLSMVSHPSKFSHPSAKTSSIIAHANAKNDGYLRSGNVLYSLDVFGNAAAMDVYKFLSLQLSNHKTILENLEEETELVKHLFNFPNVEFKQLRQKFLEIKSIDKNIKTDQLVKQVYFPVEKDGYHLLSILTPSGLVTELKQHIDKIRFSEQTKLAKEHRRKNENDAQGFADIYNLTVTAYGGTKPQNISVLNSQNGGRSYLLSSVPPTFKQRKVRLPNRHFFKQNLYPKNYLDSFKSLHKLLNVSINNINIRDAIKNIIQYIIDQILFVAFCVRQNQPGWSTTEHYQKLSLNQRIWLDDLYKQQRHEQTDWQDYIIKKIVDWFFDSYESLIPGAYKLGDGEFAFVRTLLLEALQQDKEFF